MDELLKISRELTDCYFSNNSISLNKKHYYIFVIAKFIMYKEKVLVKTGERSLFFNNETSEEEKIKFFTSQLRKCAKYKVNSYTYDYKNKCSIDDEDLWLFNKVRDSIAHGMFDIDFNNGLIIINNDHLSDSDYMLKCKIPITLLDMVTRDNYKDEIDILDIYVPKNDNYLNYKFHNAVYPGVIVSNNAIFFMNSESLLYLDLFRKDNHKRPIIFMDLDNGTIKFDKKIGKKIDKKKLNKALVDSYNLYARLLLEEKNISIDSLRANKAINEIRDLTNIGDKKAIALFSYAMILFSKMENDGGDLSKIVVDGNFSFDFYNPGANEDYVNKLNRLDKTCNLFILKILTMYENLDKCSDNDKSKGILKAIKKVKSDFLRDASKNIYTINDTIITSIRNAIMHDNISYNDKSKQVGLVDQANHMDMESMKFSYMADLEKCYKLIKTIDMCDSNEDLLEIVKCYIDYDNFVCGDLEKALMGKCI